MQTFLPFPNFEKTARVLDSRRLGKQRVEAFQILNIILGRTNSLGWRNHPAVKMWGKNPNALKVYFNKIVSEWERRGFQNSMKRETVRGPVVFPSWIGDRKFHASHRSNLLRKDKNHYSKFNWREKDDIPYFWPTK